MITLAVAAITLVLFVAHGLEVKHSRHFQGHVVPFLTLAFMFLVSISGVQIAAWIYAGAGQ